MTVAEAGAAVGVAAGVGVAVQFAFGKKIVLNVNREAEEFYIDAEEGYLASDMRDAIAFAEFDCWLEVMGEDECPAELTETGAVRRWLALMS